MLCHIDGIKGKILGLVLLLLFRPLPSQAHSGAVAIAVPVEGIAVDGDLSDWPEGMREYPIRDRSYNDLPKDLEDFQGAFQIGYSARENALYIAVQVRDESIVIDTTMSWYQDGCQISVDAKHGKERVIAGTYSIRGDSPFVYGPEVKRADFSVAVKRATHAHLYEWRIDIQEKTQGKTRLQPKMSLGVTVQLHDSDGDGSFSIMNWGQAASRNGLGDVLLIEAGDRTGRIEGRVAWETGRGVARTSLRLSSLSSDALWLETRTDRRGNYAVEVPAGSYGIEPEIGLKETRDISAEVGEGRTVEVDDLVVQSRGVVKEPGAGRKVKAGEGRRVKAGEGIWKGPWQTLDIEDGLPNPTVTDIFEDREGNLWLATWGGGVSRYDSRGFVTYTFRDGLGSDAVTAVLQDRQGNMWFGTTEGLTRYDGREFVTYTTRDGLLHNRVLALAQDTGGNLWVGTGSAHSDGGVSRFDGESFTNFTTADGLVHDYVCSILEDGEGHLWFGTYNGVSRFDGRQDVGERFTNFTTADGLANREVLSIAEDRQGNMWFAVYGVGVARYDGEHFTSFSKTDGLASPWTMAIAEDRQGNLWIGTEGGVSRFDGQAFTTYTTEDGLASQKVMSILEDRSGYMWFGTGWSSAHGGSSGNGVSRFTGEEFVSYTKKDGLVSDRVISLLEDRQGRLWFGTTDGVNWYDENDGQEIKTLDGIGGQIRCITEDRQGRLWFGTYGVGAFWYDGSTPVRVTVADGLANYQVKAIVEDRAGNLWFGTNGGASRYDGRAFKTFATEEGLADSIFTILEDRKGHLWFGTSSGLFRYDGRAFTHYPGFAGAVRNQVGMILEDRAGNLWFGTRAGASRYDGQAFTPFAVERDWAQNVTSLLLEDREGHLWFAAAGGGLLRYDGLASQSLHRRDGLANNVISAVLQDRRGDIWIGTDGGVTRYRPHRTPSPPVRLVKVLADRDYGPVSEIRLPVSQDYLAFEFQGISFKTRVDKMVYLYRLVGHDNAWKQTREGRVSYTDLPRGEYLFQVKAVDRDLNYSEKPAQTRVIIHPPYQQIAFVSSLAVTLFGLLLVSGYAVKRRRDQHRAERELMREIEEELQTAHDLQMGLMPGESPQVKGLDITGQCIPANHVGGDLFQYHPISENRFAISLADVTGHAMEAAVPVMVFSGVLESEIKYGHSLDQLFASLNETLNKKLDSRTYVCFAMGEIDPVSRKFQVANSGFPYPYHYRASAGNISEIQIDAYPLGVRSGTQYPVEEIQLEPGDRVVFCSDGIIEAANSEETIFGFERTQETIRQGCDEGLSAEALIDRLFSVVENFTGDAPQGDDMTIVVLEVEL